MARNGQGSNIAHIKKTKQITSKLSRRLLTVGLEDLLAHYLEVRMSKELDEKEKRLLALAIQRLCMEHGPTIFDPMISIAEKLDVKKYMEEYLQSWIGAAPK